MGFNIIKNLAKPVNNNDAVRKRYVDNYVNMNAAGKKVKLSYSTDTQNYYLLLNTDDSVFKITPDNNNYFIHYIVTSFNRGIRIATIKFYNNNLLLDRVFNIAISRHNFMIHHSFYREVTKIEVRTDNYIPTNQDFPFFISYEFFSSNIIL